MKALGWLPLLMFLVLGSPSVRADWLDKSEGAFFPGEFGKKLAVYKSFRTTWWGFLVFEPGDDLRFHTQLGDLCRELRQQKLVDRIDCGDSLAEVLPVAVDWARDLFLREPAITGARLREHFNSSLAQAGLVLPPELLKLLRVDPTESYRSLLQHALERQPIQLPKKQGIFFDESTGRYVLPLRPSFAPGDSVSFERMESTIAAAFASDRWVLLGGHASARENRRQIQRDLERVSLIGTLLLLLFGVWVVWVRRIRLLWGLPMMFVGVGAGTLATVALLGSIHGLVLSFGVGIMGLLLDYTIHGAFNSRSPHVWKSNLAGLLTTLAVFSVLAFSQIPLLRQLAVFSMVGLTFSYALIYLLHSRFSRYLAVEPVLSEYQPARQRLWPIGILMMGILPLLLWLPMKFDMRQFDFQGAKTKAVYQWLGPHLKNRHVLFELGEPGPAGWAAASERAAWGRDHQVAIENIAYYLPSAAAQADNLGGWQHLLCDSQGFRASPTEKKFFAPFFEALPCDVRSVDRLSPPLPAYLSDLAGDGHWLNVWLPETPAAAQGVKARYPQAVSLLEVVNQFPQTVARELTWMTPLCFVLIVFILWVYFRKLSLALLAMLPFGVGLGLVGWLGLLGMPFSFVSFVGVMMLLGLGVDYGIFAVDHALNEAVNAGETSEGGLTSALLLAAVTTIGGYLPLLFCQHQVLAHLGQVLSFGTLGSTLGAFWGVPLMARWLKR